MIIKLFEYLYEKGIEVYFIGQKKGECLSNYVVIKDSGTMPTVNNDLGIQVIDLYCYVPQTKYTETEKFKNKIKEIMKDFNSLRSTGTETPPVAEDDIKAFSFSIEYQNQKKL